MAKIKEKSIEQKYRKLTDIEHVLLRPGRYVGSVKPHTALTWVYDLDAGKMEQKELTWNPGLIKLFDEVISNSVDHSKRPEGAHLNMIDVSIDRLSGEIVVTDNGGIPVVKHQEYDEYVPSLIFGYLRSGSNFDDTEDSTGTGQNGEGASLTNIFSTEFTVETSDGKKKLKQTWSGNMMEKTVPKITNSSAQGTSISFTPDYAHLETTLTKDNYAKLVKRVVDIAGCNPNLKVSLNGKPIQVKAFKDYIALYVTDFEYDENDDWQVGVSHSENGFKHISFVNTTETIQGGTHVAYVAYQLANSLREFFKKKHKVDVKPTDILSHMQLFINARIIRPRYDSQTKENLITEVKEYKTTWSPSEKLINKLLKSEIIKRVLDWVEAKEKAAELAELRKLNKDSDKLSPRRIVKLTDAGLAGKEPERCILFLTEGDSAAKAGQSTRDPKTMGFLALRGKPLNVNSTDAKGLADNREFFHLMAAMGLKIGEPVKSIKQLRYGAIGIMTDADHDGAGHITGLLISNIHRFWPELFQLGVMHRFVTPLIKIWPNGVKKPPLAFYEEHDYKAWVEAHPEALNDSGKLRYSYKYYKGLGTSESNEFKEYLANLSDHLIKLEISQPGDSTVIELVFGKTAGAADRRKEWLQLEELDE